MLLSLTNTFRKTDSPYNVVFAHKRVEGVREGQPLKVCKSLWTSDYNRAYELNRQIKELNDNKFFWSEEGYSTAKERFDEIVVKIYYERFVGTNKMEKSNTRGKVCV